MTASLDFHSSMFWTHLAFFVISLGLVYLSRRLRRSLEAVAEDLEHMVRRRRR